MKTKQHFFGSAVIAALIVLSVAACRSSAPAPAPVPVIDDSQPYYPGPFTEVSAVELVAGIKAGWNLGNTLDCSSLGWLGNSLDVYRLETAWGNPETTQANINTIKNAGFNALRIPVSWTKCVDENYNIREDWMERVNEVVDYAARNDMYIVLNTHHDEDVFKFLDSDVDEALIAFQKIWEQIAVNFKDYDEKLVFEALNEPRTKGSPNEWRGGTTEEHNNLNKYYQTFVDTVRASGGNNDKRILMINTYAASGEAAAMSSLTIPNDPAANKIIVSYHAYAPYNFALNKDPSFNKWNKRVINDTTPITTPLIRAHTQFVSNGIPVILGEFGAMNKDNIEARTEWVEFYVNYAMSKGIPCFWWDNGIIDGGGELFGILDRRENVFSFPAIVEGFMRGVASAAP